LETRRKKVRSSPNETFLSYTATKLVPFKLKLKLLKGTGSAQNFEE